MYQNIGQLIEKTAEKFGDATFIEIKRRLRIERYSFSEINLLSRKFVTLLKNSGVEKGDRILIWGPNSPEWVICFFGALRSGVVVIPVDFATTNETVEKFISQTEPKKIFLSKIVPSLPNSFQNKVTYLEDVMRDISSLDIAHDPKVEPDELAEILFTSGTTGFPKGVKLLHKNILAGIEGVEQTFPVSPRLRSLSILPLSHIFEQITGLLVPYSSGATVVYLTRINPVTIVKGLRRHRITSLLVVPRILHLLLLSIERKLEKENRLWVFKLLLGISKLVPSFYLRKLLFFPLHQEFGGKLDFFACGGAPLESTIGKTWERMGFRVYQGYGSTETAALTTVNLVGGSKIALAGKVAPQIEIKIAPDGEVLVKGQSVFPGYWNNEEKTTQAFDNSWYKTGDIGKLDKYGWLQLLGREKFRIVLPDGRKVYPEDVEVKLNNHPKIKDSCVLGLEDQGETVLHAVILTDYPQDLRQIITEINKRLESSQQISHFSAWPATDFPRLRTLKVDRAAVEKVVSSNLQGQFQKEESEKEKEKLDRVTELVAQIAEIDPAQISKETNLVVDLKFDSLLRVELISAFEEELGALVDEAKITPETTVGKLKQIVSQSEIVVERKRSPWPRSLFIVKIRTALQNFVIFPLHAFFTPLKVSGKENLSNISDPAIFFINHLGPHDMLVPLRLLSSARREKIAIAADSKGWNRFLAGFFMELLADAYPFVKEGSGIRESLEFTGELIDNGYSLLIAPEGRFSPTGNLQSFRKGTGLLAVEFGIDLVPIKIDKNYQKVFPEMGGRVWELFPKKRKQIEVKIGKSLNFSRDTNYDSATEKMEEAMRTL